MLLVHREGEPLFVSVHREAVVVSWIELGVSEFHQVIILQITENTIVHNLDEVLEQARHQSATETMSQIIY